MLDFFADLGLRMAGCSERTQSLIFFGYCVLFGISGLADQWLGRRAKARRPVPSAIAKFWFPIYLGMLVIVTVVLFLSTTAVKLSAPFDTQLESLPAQAQAHIDMMRRASAIGFAVIAYIGIVLWFSLRECESRTAE